MIGTVTWYFRLVIDLVHCKVFLGENLGYSIMGKTWELTYDFGYCRDRCLVSHLLSFTDISYCHTAGSANRVFFINCVWI